MREKAVHSARRRHDCARMGVLDRPTFATFRVMRVATCVNRSACILPSCSSKLAAQFQHLILPSCVALHAATRTRRATTRATNIMKLLCYYAQIVQ